MFTIIFEQVVINGIPQVVIRNAQNGQIAFIGELQPAVDWYVETSHKFHEQIEKAKEEDK